MDKMQKRNFLLGEIREGENRTLEASLSSEHPVQRMRGKEILVHDQKAVDLSRAPLPLLASHDSRQLPVGIVENLRIEGGKLRGSLRFGESQRALETYADAKSGILRNISIGYLVQETERRGDSYLVTKWLPYEASLVAVPADPSVGIGRSFNPNSMENRKMDRNDILKAQKRALDELEILAVKADLSDDENARLDALRGEVAGYDKRLEVLDDLAKRRGVESKTPKIEVQNSPLTANNGEVRILRPNESFAAATRSELPDGIKPEELSLGRFLRGIVTGDWTGAEAEKRMAMAEGTSSLGGALVPTPLSSKIIDLSRNAAVIFQAGASTVPMTANTLKLAKVDGDLTGYWRAENAAITESEMAFSPLTFTVKALAALCRISIELLEDAEGVNAIIENSIAQALALELDRAALFGSGSGAEPTGLYGYAGVQEIDMGENGAAITDYGKFSLAAQKVYEKNGVPGAFVYSPRTWGTLDTLMNAVTGDPLVAPASFQAAPKLVSNQVPNDLVHGTAANASAIFTGEWPNLLVGLRNSLTIEASRVAGSDSFSKMQVMIRAYLRADMQLARTDKFVKITGVIPAA